MATPTFALEVDVFHKRVAKVVLTRPTAITQSFDGNQRDVELEFSAPAYSAPTTVSINVTVPDLSLLPRGIYMLWVVESTTADTDPSPDDLVPSQAKFVKFG